MIARFSVMDDEISTGSEFGVYALIHTLTRAEDQSEDGYNAGPYAT